ncbi:MAG: hypothetical protein ACM33U_09490 [Solirubrobacterales bacterium]|nr:hypothetical protein [Solirubrobacterales bacterium]
MTAIRLPARPDHSAHKLAAIGRDLKIRGYTVGQFPNPPLWVALAALLVAWLTDDGSTIDDLARAISYVALTVWAYEEAANGVNGFRKALGMGALVLIVVAVARAVG